jgi:hypothetical protein
MYINVLVVGVFWLVVVCGELRGKLPDRCWPSLRQIISVCVHAYTMRVLSMATVSCLQIFNVHTRVRDGFHIECAACILFILRNTVRVAQPACLARTLSLPLIVVQCSLRA